MKYTVWKETSTHIRFSQLELHVVRGGFCFIPGHLVHLTTFNLEMKQLVDLREFNLSMLIIN